MKRLIVLFGIVAMLAACFPAGAQQHDRRFGGRGPAKGTMAPPPQQPAGREAGWDSRRAPPQERMTPEERRQLRRDIDEHGREVYRERPGDRRR